jgi:hypothetical protein
MKNLPNMKNLYVKIITLILSIIFISCDKDETPNDNNGGSNNTVTNSFSYKGVTYLTPTCYYSPMYTAEGAQGGTYELFFPTSGVTFEKVRRTNSFGTFYDSYPKGIGNAIKLRFTSINRTNLPPGNYSYSYASTTPEVFGFISVYTGYDFTRLSGTRDRPSQSNKGNGQVTISKNGDTSTISYQFTFDTGEKVTGSFKGVLNLDWYSTFNNSW